MCSFTQKMKIGMMMAWMGTASPNRMRRKETAANREPRRTIR